MKTIGFTEKYYTLWNVGTTTREYSTKYGYYEVTPYTYIQNLSMDFDKAKAKLEGSEYNVDLELRGHSSFVRKGDKIKYDAPANVFAFGEYEGLSITEVKDLEYTKWYLSETDSIFAKNYLLGEGYKIYKGIMYSPEALKAKKAEIRKEKYINSLVDGHHFEDGSKVELEIKEIDRFFFEGMYGTTYVITYASKEGLKLKYMGASPADVSNKKYVPIKASVKLSEYNGVNETKLQRIKILK